jgi:opacity protein-like surface antigen
MVRVRDNRQAVRAVALMALLMTGLAATGARAQGIGVGPRLVFASGGADSAQVPAESASGRFTGGFIRLRTGSHIGVEASVDYRSTTNAAGTVRVRSMPVQGSLLYFPIQSAVQPYLVGGIGWYKEKYDTLGQGASALAVDSSKVGYHAGVGTELRLGRHASFLVDYRYTFINFGSASNAAGTALKAAAALTSVAGLLSMGNSLGLAHQGSTWTTGMAVYF